MQNGELLFLIQLSKMKILIKNKRNEIFSSFLRQHNFDGLEVDWEYPGIRGGQPDDKYYLTIFLQVNEKKK